MTGGGLIKQNRVVPEVESRLYPPVRQSAKAQSQRAGEEDGEGRKEKENSPPAHILAEGSSEGSCQGLREHHAHQEVAQRELPALIGYGVADVGEADRDQASARGTGASAQQGQTGKVGGQPARARENGIAAEREQN